MDRTLEGPYQDVCFVFRRFCDVLICVPVYHEHF